MVALRLVSRVPALRTAGLRFASAAPASSAAATSVDPEHKAWLEAVKKYPVVIPTFEWTLEWALPSPPPLHQFEQSPVCIEVKDRNPDPDALLYRGANVVGGYAHPNEPAKRVTQAEHQSLKEQLAKAAGRVEHNGHFKY